MIKPIIFNIDELLENGFNCYIIGRSYDLEENGQICNPENAVKFYKKGYYEYHDILCQYSIAISNYLGDFDYLFTEEDKKIEFPSMLQIESLSNSEDFIQSTYAKFVLAAYYNYGLAGVEKDEEKAYEIILDCAQKGHIGAMFDLGAKDKFKNRTPDSLKYLELASQNGSNRATEELKENVNNKYS